jgi:hypothetical protein
LPTLEEIIKSLGEAIDEYGLTIDKQLASLKSRFYWDLFFTIFVPLAATVIAYFFSNLAVALTPLGVGVANMVQKVTTSQSLLLTYGRDKSALETRINFLRVNLKLSQSQAPPDRDKTLDDIRLKLLQWTQ